MRAHFAPQNNNFNECYICFGGSILLISQTLKPNRGVPEIFKYRVFHDMIRQGFVYSWVARGFSLCDRQIRALLASVDRVLTAKDAAGSGQRNLENIRFLRFTAIINPASCTKLKTV